MWARHEKRCLVPAVDIKFIIFVCKQWIYCLIEAWWSKLLQRRTGFLIWVLTLFLWIINNGRGSKKKKKGSWLNCSEMKVSTITSTNSLPLLSWHTSYSFNISICSPRSSTPHLEGPHAPAAPHIFYTSHLPVKSGHDIGKQQAVYSGFSEINANES